MDGSVALSVIPPGRGFARFSTMSYDVALADPAICSVQPPYAWSSGVCIAQMAMWLATGI